MPRLAAGVRLPSEAALFSAETAEEAQTLKERYDREQHGAEIGLALEGFINGDRPEFGGFQAALRSFHPTLLGKLANAVMEVVDERKGDGRLASFHRHVDDVRPGCRVSEVRQWLV